jgi:hypothetical protein
VDLAEQYLAGLLKGRSIRSIVDDMDHDFAITYFAVDQQLIGYATNAAE